MIWVERVLWLLVGLVVAAVGVRFVLEADTLSGDFPTEDAVALPPEPEICQELSQLERRVPALRRKLRRESRLKAALDREHDLLVGEPGPE